MPNQYAEYSAGHDPLNPGALQFARELSLAEDGMDRQWLSVLGDGVEIVVRDLSGVLSPLDVLQALRAIRLRETLEVVARMMLPGATRLQGEWHVVTMDLGFEPKRRGCDLLMCFVFSCSDQDMTSEDLYEEVSIPMHMDSANGEDAQGWL